MSIQLNLNEDDIRSPKIELVGDDELQCLETFLDYLIARDNGTLDEHYEKLLGE